MKIYLFIGYNGAIKLYIRAPNLEATYIEIEKLGFTRKELEYKLSYKIGELK